MRLLIFTDVNGPATSHVLGTLLRLTRERGEFNLSGIVTTRPGRFRISVAARTRQSLRRTIRAVANPEIPLRSVAEPDLDLFRWGRRHGIPVLVPDGGDPNDPQFVRHLAEEVRPDVAFSYCCQRIFRRPLLSTFSQAVNYHDGLIPAYRGVMATSFSIFAGESQSGLTFHRMNESIDAGPILLQDSVAIDERSHLAEVSRRKRFLAVAALPRLLDRIAEADPGRPPSGAGSYYSGDDWRAMTRLTQPGNANREEILRRIRAFGVVNLTLDGAVWPVSRLRDVTIPGRRTFRSADGHLLKPDRFAGVPATFFRPRSGNSRPG